MIKLILIATVLIGIAFLAIGIGIFFLPKRRFPETEVGHNKDMKRLGIECAKCREWRRYRQIRRFQNVKVDFTKLSL